MNITLYRDILHEAPFGYGYHKILLDENGIPLDYIFLEVNKAFETLTGLKRENILSKKITDIIPGIRDEFDWIKFYGEVALNQSKKEFEQFSATLNKWYKVQTYSPEKFYFITLFTDITNEKMQKQELENFFDVNLDLLCIADTDGNFIKVNKSWEQTLGYTTEELCEKKFLDFIHPDDLESTYQAISRLSRQEQILNFVNRYRCKDGSYRFIEWRSQPEGKLIYAAARDITERIETEEALRISENRLSSILNSMEEAVYSINISHLTYIFMSPSIKKICGRSHEEFLKDFELYKKSIHPEDEPIYNSAMDSLYINGYTEIEYRVIHTDGIIRWVHDRLKIISDDNNKPVRIDGMIYDITQRVHAENESRQLIQAIEQSSNAIVITSAEREILYVNSAYGEMTGFPITDIIGEKICILLPEDNEEICSAFTEGKKWQGEIQNVRNDFTEYWARINITPVKNSNNQLTAFIILQEDISQEKIAEKEKEELLSKLQKKNFELIRLNNEKNQLLGMAAHDLRSPISVVQMYSNYILDCQSENLTNEQKSFLETIHSTSRAMNKLLSDVLDISKIESGKIDLSLELNDLNSLLKSNITLNAVFAEKKNIKIRYQLETSLDKFYFDMNKIEQVLNNLIGNAIKFSHSGTSIQVVSKITGENVVIEIMDQGQGIPEEEMPRLFEAFKKLSPRPTGGEESTGLGLAIVKRLIEAHEGSISAQSKVGIGTKFTITLPYRLKI